MIDMVTTIISGVSSFLNGSVFPTLLATGGIIYFGWTYYRANMIANRNRKKVQMDIINRTTIVLPKKDYYVVCEGSKDTQACTKVSAIDIQQCNFSDSNGKPLDLPVFV